MRYKVRTNDMPVLNVIRKSIAKLNVKSARTGHFQDNRLFKNHRSFWQKKMLNVLENVGDPIITEEYLGQTRLPVWLGNADIPQTGVSVYQPSW